MKFPRPAVDEVSVNMAPLIDVVFLLLIFFMVSTTFNKERELVLDLPKAVAKEVPAEAVEAIEIEIDAQGNYAINGRELVNRDPDTIRRALDKMTANAKDQPVIIAADAEASYQSVVTVMDVCGQLGLAHLRMTTQQLDANP